MTPREFDAGVVQSRLRLMSMLLDDLASVGQVDARDLRQDRMLRHAVERILSQLVELAVAVNNHVGATLAGKAPADYRASFQMAAEVGVLSEQLAARLQPSVGLRNVLAHEYVDVDLSVVATAVAGAQTDYREYVTQTADWLRRVG